MEYGMPALSDRKLNKIGILDSQLAIDYKQSFGI